MLVAEWDFEVEKEVAREEAWKQGVEQGILKTARAMQNEGMDVNTIARITGLTVDDVLKL